MRNAFADGSVINPDVSDFALGGFGVVQVGWRDRGTPTSLSEDSYAHHQLDGSDLHLWGPVPGMIVSSTRAEIAGGLLALNTGAAINLGSDSLNFIRALRHILEGKPRRKPWGLWPNGDLLELVEQHVLAKGVNAVNGNWIKGHATIADVEVGITTSRDRLCNDASDLVADKGVEAHASGLAALAHVYAFRRQVHLQLLKQVQALNVCVFHCAKEQREAALKAAKLLDAQSGMICPFMPPGPSAHTARNLLPRWPSKSCVTSDHSFFMQCWHFLRAIKFAPAGASATTPGHTCTQGTSWVELLCAFELMGGSIDPSSRDDAAPRMSLRNCLLSFVAMCRRVATLCMQTADSCFLKPSKSPSIRLRSLGFTNFVTCIAGNVVFPALVHGQLLACLVQLKGHLSKAKLTQLASGTLSVTPARLPLRGCPAWRRIFKVHPLLPHGNQLFQPPASVVLPSRTVPHDLAFGCPGCGHFKIVSRISLYKGGKWKQLHCMRCYSACTSRLWTCSCNHAWVGCSRHAPLGFACGARRANARVLRRGCVRLREVGELTCTDHLPPPRLDSPPCAKRRRSSASSSAPRQHVASSPLVPSAVARVLPRKRGLSPDNALTASRTSHLRPCTPGNAAPSNPNWGTECITITRNKSRSVRPKPKPKAKSAGLDAIEAFARLREARANPL